MAQDIEVKSFKQVEASADAFARKDINGVICGLVRVQLKEKNAQFEGNIIGDVTFRNGEYWVYMPKGSKRIETSTQTFCQLPSSLRTSISNGWSLVQNM